VFCFPVSVVESCVLFLSYKLFECLMEKQNPSKKEREREIELEIDAILLFRS
jgi:hypothetical protein